jgi:hypothetical protein
MPTPTQAEILVKSLVLNSAEQNSSSAFSVTIFCTSGYSKYLPVCEPWIGILRHSTLGPIGCVIFKLKLGPSGKALAEETSCCF